MSLFSLCLIFLLFLYAALWTVPFWLWKWCCLFFWCNWWASPSIFYTETLLSFKGHCRDRFQRSEFIFIFCSKYDQEWAESSKWFSFWRTVERNHSKCFGRDCDIFGSCFPPDFCVFISRGFKNELRWGEVSKFQPQKNFEVSHTLRETNDSSLYFWLLISPLKAYLKFMAFF